MKAAIRILCLGLLAGALGIATCHWGGGASARAAAPDSSVIRASNYGLVVPPRDGPPPFRFEHLSAKQGLSSTEVWSVLRDRRGFLWFGTLDGLNRYDGYKMKVFKYALSDPTSLSDNKVRTLYEDRAGTLWIGTWDGGLNRYEPDSETFTRFQHDPANPGSLSSDSVASILEDRAGTLWVSTRGGGLDRLDKASGTFSHYRHDPAGPTSLGNDNVFPLWEDADGTLWAGTDGGLDHLDPATGTFTHYRHDPADPTSLSADPVRALFVDDQGTMWVGTWGGGLDRFDRTAGTFTHYQNDPNDSTSLSQDAVFSIHQDATGALWVGTLAGGLNRLDPATGKFRRFGPDDEASSHEGFSGFSATQVTAVTGDASSEWFATGSGIFALDLRPKPFHVLKHDPDDPNSLAANEIDAIYEDPQGVLWVSTASTGLNRIDRAAGKVTHFRHDPSDPASLSADDIWDIAPSRDGSLWLATFGGGLEKFDPATGQAVHYRHDPTNPASLGSDRITGVLEDRSGYVWIATWDAGVDRFDPGTGVFTHFRNDPADPTSLSDNAVYTLSEDRNGDLWIGTVNGGLNRFDPATGAFIRFQGQPGESQTLPSNSVTSVYLDRAGALWIGTWGGGLARVNPATGEATQYDHDNGLPSDAVFEILEDDQGRLWLSTSNGLSRFDPQSETFRNYDEQDGLPGNVFESGVAFQSRGGEMFFGATEGLLAFIPDQIHDNLTVPPVVITDFLLSNQPVPIGETSVLRKAVDETAALTLSYQDRVISFEFAALNYIAPEKNRYRYKLEGFDKDWTEVASDRRLVTYTNLDPGKYAFRVLGSNADGVWNEAGASLALTIAPPWWETTWFRLSSGLLLVGLVAGGFVWQRRTAANRQRKLEVMVVERTQELQDARHQISTLFDSTPLGICIATVEGKILGVNRAIQRMTGYSEDEMLGADIRLLYAYPDQRVQLLEQLRTDGFVSNFGIRFRRRDDSHYFASLSLSELEIAGQAAVLGVSEDVTDQIEARQALTMLHRMSYDIASISDVAALVNHAVPQLHQIVDFQWAALALVDESDEVLAIYAYASPELPPDVTIPHISISAWPFLQSALAAREPTYVRDMQASEAIQADLNAMQATRLAVALKSGRSWLGLPLRVGERAIGVLSILHAEVDLYAANDIELAQTFANQLAVAIHNIQLSAQARDRATADERSRIARELHDSVTQTLFTASVLAEAAPRIWNRDQDIARQNMEKLSVLIRGALAEMRSLLLELRPGAPVEQSLGEMLSTLAEATRTRSNATVSLSVEEDHPLPADVSMTLYRIAQEALNNVVKHAEATRVEIALLVDHDCLALRVRDDGRGFDPLDIPAGHMGISIMAERAQKIGAHLQISSQPGGGTDVSATWPAGGTKRD